MRLRLTLILLIAASGVRGDDRLTPDTPEQIATKLASIAEHNRPVFALRYWGDSVIAQVKRVKLIPKNKPKDQPGLVTGFAWPIVDPDVYDMYTVDVAGKAMSKLTVPGLKDVISLTMDGAARVAFGYDDMGGSALKRQSGDGWHDVPLPREFLDAPRRVVVPSDTTLALLTAQTIHVREKDRWRTTPMPPMKKDRLGRPRSIDWALSPSGRHFGRNYYVGWQESEFTGCLLALDLTSPNPEWTDMNGVADPAIGLPRDLLVAAIRQGPNDRLWVAHDGEYVGEDVYRFDGKQWREFWKGPQLSDLVLVDMSIGPNEECYLLSARPPARVLRVAPGKTDLVLTIPGMATSMLVDRHGNLLVGTTGHDLLICEKARAGFRVHHVAPSP